MIGLDTNILVRYAERDDAEQADLADRLIDAFTATDPGYVPQVVLVETWWVLNRAYKRNPAAIAAFIANLLEVESLVVQNADLVYTALRAVTTNKADFADALIAATAAEAGCTETKTFDTLAAKRAGMNLLR